MAKIIVIGGGTAGLTAASTLAEKNHDVILLEARDRLGGRILTVTANDGKTPIELGVSYWEGFSDNPFFQQYFSKEIANVSQPFAKYCKGPLEMFYLNDVSSMKIDEMKQKKYYDHAAMLLKKTIKKSKGINYREMIDSCDLSTLNTEDAFWVKKIMEWQCIHQTTALEEIGLPDFCIPSDEIHLNACSDDANFNFVGNGYDKLIIQLTEQCKALGVKIMLKKPAVSVCDQGGVGVGVKTQEETFWADKVVCAIPLGVLKKEANNLFVPPLSKDKQAAIAAMGVHASTRIVLEFPKIFWNKSAPYILLGSSQRQGLREFRNNALLHHKAILQTPSYAIDSKTLDDSALIDCVMNELQKVYGGKTTLPTNTHIYRWSEDPYALGAYPYRTLQMNEMMHQALEKPEGNIYFASADFSRHGFSVHHAYALGKKNALACAGSLISK